MSTGAAETPGRPRTSAARVGLVLGGIVLGAVVIFGLGVMLGSRVAGRVPEFAAAPSALPPATLQPPPSAPPAPAASVQPDKLTFYDRLSGVAPPAPVVLPESKPFVPGLPPAPPDPPESHARQPETPPPPAPAAVAPPKIEAKRALPSKADATAQIRKLAGTGRFAVQVGAVSDRAAAAKAAAALNRDGFEAVTVMASVKGKILYRIRVGSFPSKPAAAKAAELFQTAFGLSAIAVEN